MKKRKTDARLTYSDAPSELPSPATIELGRRLSVVADLFETRKNAASAAGVHVDSLYRYMRGDQSPTFDVVANMCTAKGVSLDWVATGNGAMYAAERALVAADSRAAWPKTLDQPVDVLAKIIVTVDQLVVDLGLKATIELKAQLVAGLFESARTAGALEPVIEKLRLTLGALQKTGS